MKHLKILSAVVVMAVLFTACKKDKPASPPSSSFAGGIYVGKYGTGNGTPVVFFSFNLKAGGALEELDETGDVIGRGTWTINGNNFNATSNYVAPANNKFSIVATYNAAGKKLTGTWGYGTNNADGGKWHMTKQ